MADDDKMRAYNLKYYHEHKEVGNEKRRIRRYVKMGIPEEKIEHYKENQRSYKDIEKKIEEGVIEVELLNKFLSIKQREQIKLYENNFLPII